MDLLSGNLRRLCDRFRVLIIGRWNAGKAAILEKLTRVKPEIRNKEGRLVVRASYLNFDSQVDGYRMTQQKFRRGMNVRA